MPLTLVPTPIGNLEDITLRALRVLHEADVIACEDTRTSSILLRHYNITRPLTSFHVHNENEKLSALLDMLRRGDKVAVISDAGTPGISDPGWILLKRALDDGIEVDVLPGASAVLPAVLMSGLAPQPFVFMGFPPEKPGERAKLFNEIKNFPFTLCFYISPHKAERHLADMIETLGDRHAALVREISKIFQESIRGSLSEIIARVRDGIKGELVLVVEGEREETSNEAWRDEARELHDGGVSVKDIVKLIEGKYNIPRNEIKKELGLRS
ncbi:MAG: 16S rRNA (cytidine(1402)-2'-O)-methyltransferase [Synergistaceae bacterium]|nr:16S rRNA (cytidine(1402)-2'-O)-methyltransferase [Synergistaceae bacterium]